jgi:hypothetical protein
VVTTHEYIYLRIGSFELVGDIDIVFRLSDFPTANLGTWPMYTTSIRTFGVSFSFRINI